MKKTALLFFLFIPIVFIHCTAEKTIINNSTVICGELPYKNQKLYLILNPRNLRGDHDIYVDSTSIDSAGHFIMNTQCYPDSKYTLRAGVNEVYVSIFCKPGDSLVINLKSNDELAEILYDNGGATKFHYDFIKKYSSFDNKEYMESFLEKNWQKCYAIVDNRTQVQSALLIMNSYLLLSYPALKRELDDIVRYQASNDKLYLLNHYYTDDKDSAFIQDKRTTDFVEKIQFDTGDHELTGAYANLITSYLGFPYHRWSAEIKKTKDLTMEERLTLRFDFCKAHFKGRARDYGMFYSLYFLFQFYKDSIAISVAQKQLNDFKQFVTDKRYLELYTAMLNNTIATCSGQIAPNFTLQDINSQNISLSDFKGKTVYMEFTGSWCMWCRKEIPAILELQKKFKGNPNVQFVSIWMEQPEKPSANWIKYVQETGVGGVHLYSASQLNGEVPRSYQIGGAPTFMIIDKTGRIVETNSKRPSHEGIYEDIIRIAGK